MNYSEFVDSKSAEKNSRKEFPRLWEDLFIWGRPR